MSNEIKKTHDAGSRQDSAAKEIRKRKVEAAKTFAGGAAMAGLGGFLYSFGGHLAANYGGGGATALGGGMLAVAGVGAAIYATVKFIDNSPKLKKALIHGFNNVDKASVKMEDYVQDKMKPFVKKSIENIASKTKSKIDEVDKGLIPFTVDRNDGKGQQPMNWAAENPKKAGFFRKILGGR